MAQKLQLREGTGGRFSGGIDIKPLERAIEKIVDGELHGKVVLVQGGQVSGTGRTAPSGWDSEGTGGFRLDMDKVEDNKVKVQIQKSSDTYASLTITPGAIGYCTFDLPLPLKPWKDNLTPAAVYEFWKKWNHLLGMSPDDKKNKIAEFNKFVVALVEAKNAFNGAIYRMDYVEKGQISSELLQYYSESFRKDDMGIPADAGTDSDWNGQPNRIYSRIVSVYEKYVRAQKCINDLRNCIIPIRQVNFAVKYKEGLKKSLKEASVYILAIEGESGGSSSGSGGSSPPGGKGGGSVPMEVDQPSSSTPPPVGADKRGRPDKGKGEEKGEEKGEGKGKGKGKK